MWVLSSFPPQAGHPWALPWWAPEKGCSPSQPHSPECHWLSRMFHLPNWNSVLLNTHPVPSPCEPPSTLCLGIWLLWGPHRSRGPQHLCFCVWLFHSTIMSSSFPHIGPSLRFNLCSTFYNDVSLFLKGVGERIWPCTWGSCPSSFCVALVFSFGATPCISWGNEWHHISLLRLP